MDSRMGHVHYADRHPAKIREDVGVAERWSCNLDGIRFIYCPQWYLHFSFAVWFPT